MKKPNAKRPFNFRRNCVVAAVVMAAGTASSLAQASIALTGYSENAGAFTATYAFTPDPSPGLVLPPGSSWLASLTESFTPTGLGVGTFQFDWSGQHPLTGLIASDTCQFQSTVLNGTVCSQASVVADGTASDTYNFTVNLVSGGGTATFTGTHSAAAVPLPPAAWLFASGLAFTLVWRQPRKRAQAR